MPGSTSTVSLTDGAKAQMVQKHGTTAKEKCTLVGCHAVSLMRQQLQMAMQCAFKLRRLMQYRSTQETQQHVTCTKPGPNPSMVSSLMVRLSSEWMMLLRFMMVPISYPRAIKPPRIRTLTWTIQKPLKGLAMIPTSGTYRGSGRPNARQLVTESRLICFPLATKMFRFTK